MRYAKFTFDIIAASLMWFMIAAFLTFFYAGGCIAHGEKYQCVEVKK